MSVRFSPVCFSLAAAASVAFSQRSEDRGQRTEVRGQRSERVVFANRISFSEPLPFSQALESREVRSILPTELSSAELEQISSDILERAVFSARVTSTEYLQEIDDVVTSYINGEIDLASARLQLKQRLQELDYRPDVTEEGTLKDFSSDARINLVLRTNASMATGYGQWMQGQNAAVLDQWPAQELVRIAPRKVPRNWIQRWGQAGGQSFDGRLVAQKNDRIWTAISRFGLPYPPFDFNSGMGVRDVDRDTAVKLGVIDRDMIIQPETREFNQDLKLEPNVRAEALRTVLEDEGYSFTEDGSLTL